MLPQEFRLRRKEDFHQLRIVGKTYSSRTIVLSIASNNLPHNRYGFIVSRHYGKAVQRNRARRLMREGVRQTHKTLAGGYDIALIARQGLAGKQLADVQSDLLRLFRQAGLVES
jgi:ribonuclease P protein component